MLSGNNLLQSKIYHKRFAIKEYDFLHNGFFLLLDLDKLEETNKLKLFSINKFNFYSLYYKDYGYDKFDNPKKYILKTLSDQGENTKAIDKIYLLTMPKILGYIFNPISFWLCFDKEQNLILSVAEVNNTFGERHSYICRKPDLKPINKKDIIEKQKLLHVSPFFQVRGKYKFRFDIKDRKIKIDIHYFQDKKLSITTYIDGTIKEMNDSKLARYIILFPFLTIKVIILIHYHALRIWLKNIKFFRKPPGPKKKIS